VAVPSVVVPSSLVPSVVPVVVPPPPPLPPQPKKAIERVKIVHLVKVVCIAPLQVNMRNISRTMHHLGLHRNKVFMGEKSALRGLSLRLLHPTLVRVGGRVARNTAVATCALKQARGWATIQALQE
jgi:hypothetical protein